MRKRINIEFSGRRIHLGDAEEDRPAMLRALKQLYDDHTREITAIRRTSQTRSARFVTAGVA